MRAFAHDAACAALELLQNTLRPLHALAMLLAVPRLLKLTDPLLKLRLFLAKALVLLCRGANCLLERLACLQRHPPEQHFADASMRIACIAHATSEATRDG